MNYVTIKNGVASPIERKQLYYKGNELDRYNKTIIFEGDNYEGYVEINMPIFNEGDILLIGVQNDFKGSPTSAFMNRCCFGKVSNLNYNYDRSNNNIIYINTINGSVRAILKDIETNKDEYNSDRYYVKNNIVYYRFDVINNQFVNYNNTNKIIGNVFKVGQEDTLKINNGQWSEVHKNPYFYIAKYTK